MICRCFGIASKCELLLILELVVSAKLLFNELEVFSCNL